MNLYRVTGAPTFGVTVLILLLCFLSLAISPGRANASVDANLQFLQNHQIWDRAADIRLLQQYLNANGFSIAQEGPGSSGNETTLFGGLTLRALIRFQLAH